MSQKVKSYIHSLLSLPPMSNLHLYLQEPAQLSQRLRNSPKRLTDNSESCHAEVVSPRICVSYIYIKLSVHVRALCAH